MVVGMSKSDTLALRRILDKIAEKFGQYAYVELCEDGSGFIGDKLGGGPCGITVVEFGGLGELATILETPLADMAPYYGPRPGESHGKW